MDSAFLGQIQLFAFGYAPEGWMLCNGSLIPVSQYAALFSLIGDTYGGDGRTTFAIPNLQDASPTFPPSQHSLFMQYYICINGLYPQRS